MFVNDTYLFRVAMTATHVGTARFLKYSTNKKYLNFVRSILTWGVEGITVSLAVSPCLNFLLYRKSKINLKPMADDAFAALDSVFNNCDAPKLQSWSCKVANATSAAQVELDMQSKCRCSAPCHKQFTDSYATGKECQEALLQLRTERTEGKAVDERVWLFNYLYNNRSRSGGEICVHFRLDGVNVCEEYFTTALGFNFPNRRIQHFVRLIKVGLHVACSTM